MAEPSVETTGTVTTTGVGRPDYAAPAGQGAIPTGPVYTLSDMGELAARLKGCINTFDRRGNVVWWDDFEDNINKWAQVTSGAGAAIALSTVAARNGASSAILTTGDTTDDYAQISMKVPRPASAVIGFEFSFVIDATNTQRVLAQIEVTDYANTLRYIAQVRYHAQNNVLQYLDSAGAWQTLATTYLWRDNTYPAFHTLKFVIDWSNTLWRRIILNDVEYDMSAIPLLTSAVGVGYNYVEVSVSHSTAADANTSAYIDDAIVTQNEPGND